MSQNLELVRSKITKAADHEVTLIAVTKTFPVSDAQILHELGVRDFGENRDAEGAEKAAIVSGTWHFQGQIQSNKLKSITSWASVIHSLDDPRHFEIIEKVVSSPIAKTKSGTMAGAVEKVLKNPPAFILFNPIEIVVPIMRDKTVVTTATKIVL